MERGLYWLVIRIMIKLKDLIKDLELGKVYTDKDMPPFQTESTNEASKVAGHENVGTKKYDGKAWYWPHDYRHYLRDASSKQRKAVHNAWVKIGVPVKKTKDGDSWLEPKSNQKKKAWTIVRKVIAPKELGTPIPESINEVNVGNTYISSDGEHIELVFDKFMSGKWRTIDFNLGPRPMVSGIGTSPEHLLGMYGKLKKLSSSQKNLIKKMLKEPVNIDMVKRDGQNVNKVLKAV